MITICGFVLGTCSHSNHERKVSSQNTNLVLKVEAAILPGTLWTRKIVEERLVKTRKIFRQCGVGFDYKVRVVPKFRVRTVHFDRADTSWDRDRLDLTNKLRGTSRPLIVYIGSFRNGIAGTAYMKSLEKRWKSWASKKDVENMRNTTWIGEINITDDPTISSDFTTEAHELGHLLMDMEKTKIGHLEVDHVGHVINDEANLMAIEFNNLSTKLTPQQCQILRNSVRDLKQK